MKRTLLMITMVLTGFISTGNLKASVIYTPMNLTASQTSAWNWFTFGPDADGFGLWVNVGSALRLETYSGPVVGVNEDGKDYLTDLAYNTEIGSVSNWLTPTSQTYINDATHTTLNGKTVYVAVQLNSSGGMIYYGWMQLMVSADGLSVTLTGMAYQDVAGASLFAGVIDRQVFYGSGEFLEDLSVNDGTIGTGIFINLEGVDFSQSTGAFTAGTHYIIANLPAGLTMEIRATDTKHAMAILNGKGTAHAVKDTVPNLAISFLDAAFAGIQASTILDAVKPDLMIKYFDPYKILYEDMVDIVCGANGWGPFSNSYFGNDFGLWHDGTDMRIETYAKSVIGTAVAGRSYFTPLDAGTVISSSSAWVETGNWPNEPFINTATYTTWNGKHKYAGVQLTVGNAVLYGWLNLEVSADGKTLTLYDWAFNAEPEAPITAGQIPAGSTLTSLETLSATLFPNPVEGEMTIHLNKALTHPARLTVHDIAGKMVFQQELTPDGTQRYLVTTEQLNPGVYFVHISSPEVRFNGKIIRE